MGATTDLKTLDASLEKSGGSALWMVLKWSTQYGVGAVFALILLVQTNAKLDRLIERMERLVAVIESKK